MAIINRYRSSHHQSSEDMEKFTIENEKKEEVVVLLLNIIGPNTNNWECSTMAKENAFLLIKRMKEVGIETCDQPKFNPSLAGCIWKWDVKGEAVHKQIEKIEGFKAWINSELSETTK